MNFEDFEYKSLTLTSYNFFHLKPKFGKIAPKTKILSKLSENIHTSQFESPKYESGINILRFYIWNINLG